MRCDPPTRHAAILYDAQSFRYLPPLAGVVRQPYFRESDGVLIRASGTEPLLRVMVEARDAAQASICAERLAQAARQG